ncbi:MAG: hypothetical protein VX815_02375 [Gemmatimonadota bacterium]|jgi:hypothetical protein|nr:hypothetical protein [Gemmatimonadota bacterium]
MSHEHGDHGPKEPIGWMDKPDFVKRLFWAFYALCAVLVVAEVVFGKATEHPHPNEGWFGFYAVYGFISFWFLVLLAKPMRKLLIRSEDYYEGDEGAEDAG